MRDRESRRVSELRSQHGLEAIKAEYYELPSRNHVGVPVFVDVEIAVRGLEVPFTNASKLAQQVKGRARAGLDLDRVTLPQPRQLVQEVTDRWPCFNQRDVCLSFREHLEKSERAAHVEKKGKVDVLHASPAIDCEYTQRVAAPEFVCLASVRVDGWFRWGCPPKPDGDPPNLIGRSREGVVRASTPLH